MPTRNRDPHVDPVGGVTGRILRKWTAGTADSTAIIEVSFAVQFAIIRYIGGLSQDNLEVLPGKPVTNHAEHKPHWKGIDNDESISENESVSRLGYNTPTHNDVSSTIQDSLKENEESQLRRIINGRCEKVICVLFEEKESVLKAMSVLISSTLCKSRPQSFVHRSSRRGTLRYDI